MSRSYSKLTWKCSTNKYHKRKARKRLRKIDDDNIGNYSSTTKKFYRSWDICDYKEGSDKKGPIVRKGRVNIKYYLGKD